MAGKKTGTREWSDKSFNCISGCYYDCRYCYAKGNAKRFNTHIGDWAIEDFKDKLDKAKVKSKGLIMFPTSHDVTPQNYNTYAKHLLTLVQNGNRVLIVSKLSPDVAEWLIEHFSVYKDQLEVRATITHTDSDTGIYFEPYAPYCRERVRAVAKLQAAGWKTSVSAEPFLSEPLKIIDNLKAGGIYNGLSEIWLGCMNYYALDNDKPEEAEILELYSKENLRRIHEMFSTGHEGKIKFKDSFMSRVRNGGSYVS